MGLACPETGAGAGQEAVRLNKTAFSLGVFY